MVYKDLHASLKRHGKTQKQWAANCGQDESRISELNRILKRHEKGENANDIDRIFSRSKCIDLIEGLKNLIGGDKVRKELLSAAEKAKDEKTKLLLKVLALRDDQIGQVSMFIDAVVLGSGK